MTQAKPLTTYKCPFEGCGKHYQSQRRLKKHVRDKLSSPYDHNHSPKSQHVTAFLSRPRQTPEEQAQRKREREKRRYESNKRGRFPLHKELDDFEADWNNEAGSLYTPHHEKGPYIFKQLRKVPYTVMPKFSIRDHPLHEEPPTITRLVADVCYADEHNKLQLIDSRSSKPDGNSKHSAKNLLECIESVASKSFDSESRSVHYAMVEVPCSPNGLQACRPKVPPLNLLTKSGSAPICSLLRALSDM